MGTDISLFAERRLGRKWLLLSGMELNPEYWPEEPGSPRLKPRGLYDTRHYSLFTILSGVLLGDALDSVAQARGLPHDLSSRLRNWADWRGEYLRWPSWLGLGEVLAFDWHGKKARSIPRWRISSTRTSPSPLPGAVARRR